MNPKEKAIEKYKSSSKEEKELLKDIFGDIFPKNVMERIKTIDNVLKENGISKKEFDKSCTGLSEDEINYRLLKLIAKALNEGWLPNWKDSDEYKYVPWFKMNDSSSASRFSYGGCDGWVTVTNVGSRLCYKSSELAKYAGTQFLEIYRKYMLIEDTRG